MYNIQGVNKLNKDKLTRIIDSIQVKKNSDGRNRKINFELLLDYEYGIHKGEIYNNFNSQNKLQVPLCQSNKMNKIIEDLYHNLKKDKLKRIDKLEQKKRNEYDVLNIRYKDTNSNQAIINLLPRFKSIYKINKKTLTCDGSTLSVQKKILDYKRYISIALKTN